MSTSRDQGGALEFITVEPLATGWRVSTTVDEDLIFLSGGRAEAQARLLGRCLASLGRDVFIEVRNRENQVVGRIRYDGAFD